MTRRLTLAIVGSIVATLLVAGFGTLVLARLGAKQVTRDQLVEQASDLAAGIQSVDISGLSLAARRQQLGLLVRAFQLEGIGFVVLTARGTPVSDPAGNQLVDIPAGLTAADLPFDRLAAGDVVTGSHGSLVYAAAPARRGIATLAVVLTRKADTQLGPAFRWFLLAAVSTVLVGAFVAARLGRKLTEPLAAADRATRQIAAGDLATRLPEPAGTTGGRGGDELAALTRSINSMAGALERSQGLERQFLLSVSHDLRTPLTSIRGYAEAIADGTATDPVAAAAVILTESRRLERLVRDLLDLAKLDSRSFRFTIGPTDLQEVAAATVESFQPDAETAGVAVDMTPAAGVMVDADTDRLAQVVANLVENALKFATSSVVVETGASNGWGWLTVADDGPGIRAEDLPHVFERLYVASRQPRRKETGSGLGLAIVRELVVAMGGDITARARPDGLGGTEMVVRLPATDG